MDGAKRWKPRDEDALRRAERQCREATGKTNPSVSLDLLVRGLFALGVTRKELAKAV
jgi:hypothetical protein